jgi:hypothetical protein
MIQSAKIMMHCGAQEVSRDSVMESVTPLPTATHYPISHRSFVENVETSLTRGGFQIVSQEHSLANGKERDSKAVVADARYFGLWQLTNQGEDGDYQWVVGVRNSHDKTFPAGIVAGTKVFVCDNLCFSGDIKVTRKHTKNVMRDFQNLTSRAVGKLGDAFLQTDQRISAYKSENLSDERASKILLDSAIDARATTPSKIEAIWNEWRKPRHEEFAPRNAWSLFNAFTEVAKGTNPTTQINRGEALHGVFDSVCGVDFGMKADAIEV